MGNGFKVGDVIHNGWAGDENCYSIVVGRSSIKTSKYSTQSCYKQRTLYRGKLCTPSLMATDQTRQTKIGHIDFESHIINRMTELVRKPNPIIKK